MKKFNYRNTVEFYFNMPIIDVVEDDVAFTFDFQLEDLNWVYILTERYDSREELLAQLEQDWE
jgi:GR25 family glycosyltransferase involved in LPS biosynthesis